MRRLKKAIKNWLNSYDLEEPVPSQIVSAREGLSSTLGMNFTLYHAQGGFVLECVSYDRQTDRRNSRLYIVRDDEDFAQQVAQCVTLESLRRPT